MLLHIATPSVRHSLEQNTLQLNYIHLGPCVHAANHKPRPTIEPNVQKTHTRRLQLFGIDSGNFFCALALPLAAAFRSHGRASRISFAPRWSFASPNSASASPFFTRGEFQLRQGRAAGCRSPRGEALNRKNTAKILLAIYGQFRRRVPRALFAPS